MPHRLLILDEQGDLSPTTQSALRDRYQVVSAQSLAGIDAEKYAVAVVVSRASLPIALCMEIMTRGIAEQVVVVGARPTLHEAVFAMRAGIADLVLDCVDGDGLTARIGELIENMEIRGELKRLRSTPLPVGIPPTILGQSQAAAQLHAILRRVAQTHEPLFVTGEAGTGKACVARIVHQWSGSDGRPLIVVRCRSAEEQLFDIPDIPPSGDPLEGERRLQKILELQSVGVVHLDEIGELPIVLQGQLAKFLEVRHDNASRLTSGARPPPRVVISSRVLLSEALAMGKLTQELHGAIANLATHVRLSPLRERGRDVLSIAQYFVNHFRTQRKPIVGFTPAVAQTLLSSKWPGNIRELKYSIIAAMSNAQRDHITSDDLPDALKGALTAIREGSSDPIPLDERERRHILETLHSVGGNKSLAARQLGVDRKTLGRKLQNYAATGSRAVRGK